MNFALLSRKSLTFKKILYKYFLIIISSPFAIITVLIIRTIKPLITIRLARAWSTRIGHFAAIFGVQWANRFEDSKVNYFDIFWLDKPICNLFFYKLVKRNFNITQVIFPIWWWNNFLPGGSDHELPVGGSDIIDYKGLLYNLNTKMLFTEEEDNEGYNWLKSKGWKNGMPFVCLLVRDCKYLESAYNTSLFGKLFYHFKNNDSFRNSNIVTYRKSIEWLINKDVFVLRMGNIAEKKIGIEMRNLVDYPFIEDKTDFLDIWLFAKCTACISTLSGLDNVSYIFGKPCLHLNALPITEFYYFHDSMFSPKNLMWKNTQKKLTLQEYFKYNFTTQNEYDSAGIIIQDLTEDEILDTVKNFWVSANPLVNPKNKKTKKQKIFLEYFDSYMNLTEKKYFIHPDARICDRWLEFTEMDVI
jgi:putative glycosyltransferase (TIGR04372 family)